MNESLETTTEVTSNQTNLNNNIGLIATSFCLIVSLILVGYIYVNRNIPVVNNPVFEITQPIVVEESGPKGSIYLTLSPIDDIGEQNQMGIYKYEFATKELSPYYVPKTSPAFSSKFKPGTDDMVVSVYETPDRLQIAQVNVEKKEYVELTTSDIFFKRHPIWSESYNLLIYSGKEEKQDSVDNTYNIYTQSVSGEHKKLTEGAIPSLSPDGEAIVVLRKDGLYQVDLITGDSKLIWAAKSDDIKTRNQFSISRDGRYIAWSFPERKELYVIEVTDWLEFKGHFKYVVKTHSSWPIFSPDSKYLAFEEFDWGPETDPENPRLVILNLQSTNLEKQVLYDLSAFNIQEMFITDWK